MKKVTFLIAFIFVVSFLMFSGSLDAQLPDLTVEKITVTRNCNLVVVVKNEGPGILPDYVYTQHHPKSAGVYVYINGNGWGGKTIWKFDPSRKLQKPGGRAACILTYKVGATPIDVKAVVDLHDVVREDDPNNNSLVRKALSCRSTPPRPRFSIYNIQMSPQSPASLALNQKVNITFDYYASVKVHIWARPFSGKSLTPDYAAHGSPLYAAGTGKGTGYFKITKGKGVIDRVRFQMMDETKKKLYLEKFVRVKYTYPGKGYQPCGIRLTSLSKTSGYPGDTFKMIGTWGATKGTKIPCINKGNMNKLIVLNWSPSELKVKIPDGLEPGKYRVGVYCNDLSQGGSYSSGWLDFIILKKTDTSVAPKRFLLDFVDAYLVYEHGKKSLQIATEKNVLSYGGDWHRAKIYNHLFDLREKFWKNFFWRVNTSRKEVYRVRNGTFGKIGGTYETLTNIKVGVVGNGANPTRFFLRFQKAYLVYVPSSKTLQITAMGNNVGNVLSYGSDWQKCNLKPYLYQLKQNVWKGFYWQINTSRLKVYNIKGGKFCTVIGSGPAMMMGVRVVK